MILPSKFVTYKESSLSKFPIVLNRLAKCDVHVMRLFEMVRSDSKDKKMSIHEYLELLDCLFVLGKIELIGEDIHRVD